MKASKSKENYVKTFGRSLKNKRREIMFTFIIN